MTKALGHKFHIFDIYIVDKLFEKIQMFLPIQKHGTNWGIWHAKIKLA
jgi:hypothetical protein